MGTRLPFSLGSHCCCFSIFDKPTNGRARMWFTAPVKFFLLTTKHYQCTFLLTRQHGSSFDCDFNGHLSDQFGQSYSKAYPFLCWIDWQNLFVWCCLWLYCMQRVVLIPKLVSDQSFIPQMTSSRQQHDSVGQKCFPIVIDGVPLDAAPSAGFEASIGLSIGPMDAEF